jgi:hypothetical protein
LAGASPGKLQAVLALQLDPGLKLGVLQAGLEWWDEELPTGQSWAWTRRGPEREVDLLSRGHNTRPDCDHVK